MPIWFLCIRLVTIQIKTGTPKNSAVATRQKHQRNRQMKIMKEEAVGSENDESI